MPLRYPRPTTIRPPVQGSEVHCIGINIRLPRAGVQTVTYYYEVLDDAGRIVDTQSTTVPMPTLVTAKPGDFTTLQRILKDDAYERAPYPPGPIT